MLILNIQFWSGDKAIAMKLARLIADIEPKFRNDVSVLFTARFDATHDEETVLYVSKKFPVHKFTTTRKATGWPNGPNQMMGESYCHCIELVRGRKVNAKAILFIESDAVPLHKDWINMLIEEYKQSGKQVVGCWLGAGDCGVEHVNGNCIIGIDFWRGKNRGILTPPSQGGWDAVLFGIIRPHAYPSRLIWSEYWLGTERNPWKGDDYLWEPKRFVDKNNPLFGMDLYPVWFHGPKNGLGIPAVRKRLLNEQAA